MKKVLEKLLAELERRDKASNKSIMEDFSMTLEGFPSGLCILAHITLNSGEWHIFDKWLSGFIMTHDSFYNFKGEKVDDKNQFIFPAGEIEPRIQLLKTEIEKL